MPRSKSPRRWPWQPRSKPAVKPKSRTVPYGQLFRYATLPDRLYLFVASVCAALHGALMLVLTVVFGRVVDSFAGTQSPKSPEVMSASLGEIERNTVWFLVCALIAFVLSFAQVRFSMLAAHRIGHRIRLLYFRSLLRQEPEWFARKTPGELAAVINNVADIEAGIGDKVATATQHVTTFLVGLVVAFTYGWKLAAVIFSVTPVLLASGALVGTLSARATTKGVEAYAEAGGIASEVLSLIRLVAAYSGQEEEASRYERSLKKAYSANVRLELLSGAAFGFMLFCILCVYGLSFWYGSHLARTDGLSAGMVLIVFFSLSIGSTALGQAAPAFKSFAVACASAPKIFDVIDRKSPIDPLNANAGLVLPEVRGEICFKNVDFAYRSDEDPSGRIPDAVLHDFNLFVPAGTSHALVGPSGCGKSTTVNLIERFYDPRRGSVTLDGVDLRDLNVMWLRSQIGYVGQTPTLFMLSIRDNIALGAAPISCLDKVTGKRIWELATMDEASIVEAAHTANAHDFIMGLPDGYDTMLGERGAQLSGGQKQRICIARALVRDPQILILDEATASLDANSERVVQDALERASAGRTTITIAHRLSTVRKADAISVIDNGRVAETGEHADLIFLDGGKYRRLVGLQNFKHRHEEMFSAGDDDQSALLEDPVLAEKRYSQKLSLAGLDSVSRTFGMDKVEGKEKPDVDSGVLRKTFRLNAREGLYIFAGVVGATVSGVVWPIVSVALTKMVQLIMTKGTVSETRLWSLSFVAIGFGALIGKVLHVGALGVSGERLTLKLRALSFRALLRQEIGYFEQENSVGALCTRLSREAALVKGVTGETLGAVMSVVASMASGLIIAFMSCWRVALVVLAIIPGVVIGGYLEMQMSAGLDSGSSKNMSASGSIASEAMDNIATVRSLGCEEHFCSAFMASLAPVRRIQNRKSTITGVAYGFSELCQYLIWYSAFKAGVVFVRHGHCTFFELLQSVMAVLFAAITLGNVAIFFPDIAASRVAGTSIYRLIGRDSAIDPEWGAASALRYAQGCRGNVKGAGMRFEYPSRPDVAVLRGLSFAVDQGQSLALVGASGCGKSTIVSLLERFYDVRLGVLGVDGSNVKTLPVKTLRSNLGIVTQETDLFNRSVRDNIVYGLGQGAAVSDNMVTGAARAANAHDFIMKLPQGYETVVGPRGDNLSGGQKQRVAIARSLIREPRILLLDEATSALDAVSEKVVQDALDNATEGRTTITIAHRLSTIRNADVIAVVHKGKIVEQGSHLQLLRLGGHYSELVKNQMARA